MARIFNLFHTLFLVFSWQQCAKAGATFDDVTSALNPGADHDFISRRSLSFGTPSGGGSVALTAGLPRSVAASTIMTVDLEIPSRSGSGIAAAVGLDGLAGAVFDVRRYGAKADGKTDDVQAFMTAWIDACRNTAGPATLLIPSNTFLVGPLTFAGPCKSWPITIKVQGTVMATTDISEYSSPEWFSIEDINGLILTGGGVFDGQGATAWQYNDCKKNNFCQILPISIKFSRLNHTIVDGITSLNSKAFHTSVFNCYNFTAINLNITAPGNSPNTDGMHISTSKLVTISHSIIGTGDDCVSIGQGSVGITVTNITCGPGHGISVGSLGKYPKEKSVSNILVKNCTIFNTTNGARIKTWAGTVVGAATGIIYEDIVMRNVKNPIIIDQTYGTKQNKASKWKISDVHFRNIRGTSITNVAVALECSPLFPCEGVELRDINLAYSGASVRNKSIVSACMNAKIAIFGLQIPPACAA